MADDKDLLQNPRGFITASHFEFCKKFIPFIYYLFIPFIYYLSGMNLLNYFSTVVFVFRCAVFIALNSHL